MSDKAAGASSDPVLKREPASPESRGISPFDGSIRGGPFCVGVNSTIVSPPTTSAEMVVPSQNGSLQNQGSGSESDSGVDAPLDFSMKSRVKKRELETPQRLENTGAPKRRALNIEANSENSNSCSPVARYHVKTEQPEGFSQLEPQTQSPPTGVPDDGKNGATEDSKRAARFGEPPTALPGALPGAVGAAMPGLGMLPNAFAASLPMYMDPRRLQQAQTQATNGNGSSGSNKSNARPFKAYPKEALSLPLGYYGIPGMMPFPSLDSVTAQAMGQAMGSEELFNQYRMYVLKCQQEQAKNSAKSGGAQGQAAPPLPQLPTQQNQPATQQSSPVANPAANNASQASPSAKSTTSETSSTVRSTSSSPTLSTTCTTPTSPGGGADPATATSGGGSAGDSKPRTPVRKRGQQMPDERKDESYWERRRKNNEAAKRSRDSRRAKEDEIAIRAAFLEQENLKLRVEVAALKNETAKLRCMLYNS